MIAKTPADYHALAATRGLNWLGPFPANVLIPTRWRCPRGHRWRARYNHIRAGHGCPECAGTRRKRPADYRRLARQRGLSWLGPEVANSRQATLWRCTRGHTWRATYTSLAGGTGCPECAGVAPLTAARLHALARERGWTWLGPLGRAHDPTGWRCARGHAWRATPGTISGGHGCPTCARKARKTEADYRALARTRGYVFLGPLPANVSGLTRWRCGCGTELQADYSSVARHLRHKGCPLKTDPAGDR